jgi:site-specific recombinase XerD
LQETHLRLLRTQSDPDSVHSNPPEAANAGTGPAKAGADPGAARPESAPSGTHAPQTDPAVTAQLAELMRQVMRVELREEAQRQADRQVEAAAVAAAPRVAAAALPDLLAAWVLDARAGNQSPQSLDKKDVVVRQLHWFLGHRSFESCGAFELRQFLVYLQEGHTEPGGRWGIARLTAPLRPVTVRDYYITLHAFFAWLERQGLLPASPMERIGAPEYNRDDIEPFTPQQVEALKAQTRGTDHPRRDLAILLFFLDTGVRASELCALRLSDVDRLQRSARVMGKGRKKRTVYFGAKTAGVLWRYLQEYPRDESGPLFLSDRGTTAGRALTRSGVFQLVQRLGQAAGIGRERCSPHTLRHTFAVSYLRAGGQELDLMRLLGHTRLAMTSRYVQMAQSDSASLYQGRSPVDRQEGEHRQRPASKAPTPSRAGWGTPSLPGSLPPPKPAPKPAPRAQASGKAKITDKSKITRARLTEAQVREIKAELGAARDAGTRMPIGDLSRRFRVARSTIKDISMGYTWAHVA